MTQMATPIAESGFTCSLLLWLIKPLTTMALPWPVIYMQWPHEVERNFRCGRRLICIYWRLWDELRGDFKWNTRNRYCLLVDLASGQMLWTGTANASSAEQQNANSGGLVGMLVQAAVNQILRPWQIEVLILPLSRLHVFYLQKVTTAFFMALDHRVTVNRLLARKSKFSQYRWQ